MRTYTRGKSEGLDVYKMNMQTGKLTAVRIRNIRALHLCV